MAHAQRYQRACVAADHPLASRAGASILRAGGNAIDAAIATSCALSVVRPYSCGLGGGFLMLLHFPRGLPSNGAQTSTVIDAISTCPCAVDSGFFERAPMSQDRWASERGGASIAVPGHVDGILHAHAHYATMPLGRLLAPAIEIARRGFAIDAHFVESSAEVIEWMRANDAPSEQREREAARRQQRFTFLWQRLLRGGIVRVGDALQLPEQALALERIVQQGREGFYAGSIARAMFDAVGRDGGVLCEADLATPRVREHVPVSFSFRDARVLSVPLPSSGGIVLGQALTMIEALRPTLSLRDGPHHERTLHALVEVCKHVFADRARWMGDGDVSEERLRGLLNRTTLLARAGRIDLERTHPIHDYGDVEFRTGTGGTSHFCVADHHGNVVSCGETINLIFGSLVEPAGCGFMLNDSMDDFLTRSNASNAFGLAQSEANRPSAGRRPLSAMSPVIALDGVGRPVMLAGGSGGPRIITGTLQTLLNAMMFGDTADVAVSRARLHHQWMPDHISIEDELLASPIADALRARGHALVRKQPVGAVQAIVREGEAWHAACDPRKGGEPDGM